MSSSRKTVSETVFHTLSLFFAAVLLVSCSSAYYSAMEKVGVHKRDILVDRVEGASTARRKSRYAFSGNPLNVHLYGFAIVLLKYSIKLSGPLLKASFDSKLPLFRNFLVSIPNHISIDLLQNLAI